MSDSMSDPAQPAEPGHDDERTYRILKWVVIVMGVLLVVGFFIIVIGMISKIPAITGAGTPSAPVASGTPYDTRVTLPADAAVVETAVGEGVVVLRLQGPGGASLLMLDPRTGQPIGSVTLAPAE